MNPCRHIPSPEPEDLNVERWALKVERSTRSAQRSTLNSQPETSPEPLSRRVFLRRTAGATAATLLAPALLSPAASPAAAAGWRLRLSTSSIHYKKLPIEQACARIAALGFEAIDIWSAHEQCPHLDDVAKRFGPRGLQELLAQHKLRLYCFSTYVGGYAKYAELLGQAGGGLAIQGSASPCPPEDLVAKMKAFLESLKPLAELAEKHQSYLAIENHGQALLDSLDSFKAFVDLNRHPRLGIALAPYHLQAIGAAVEQAIEICGRQLFFFYAWQKEPDLGQLPGHGPTDFKPWLSALAGAGYQWYVNPFMHGYVEPDAMSAALARARDYLRAQTPKEPVRTGSLPHTTSQTLTTQS
jgi:sugar phosphate isomerase/epimerase